MTKKDDEIGIALHDAKAGEYVTVLTNPSRLFRIKAWFWRLWGRIK